MATLITDLKKIQGTYEEVLHTKLKPYRSWQSYEYFAMHYQVLYETSSQSLLNYLILMNELFYTKEEKIALYRAYLEQLVHGYEKILHEDFEKQVYFENLYVTSI